MLMISFLILVGAYALIAWDKIPKVTVVMIAASLIIFLAHASAQQVFSYIDFQVLFLLIGMMIIVHITSRSGVFRWVAIELLRHTKGEPRYILVGLGVITAVLSAFIDNVTTVVIILPIVFTISKELEIDPIPFLMTLILASNIGGTATLIGDPPNIIIGTAAGLNFMDFVHELTGVVTVIFIVSILLLVYLYRKELVFKQEYQDKILLLDNSGSIKDRPLMYKSLTVLFLVIAGFILHNLIHYDAYAIALAGASVLLLFEKPRQVMHEVEWTTIFFFIGLFIVIGGFAEAGGIKLLADKLIHLTAGDRTLTTMFVLWASGFLSAIIDNIPYTVTMVPLIKELKGVMDVYPLWWALSLGACLGGNATIIGASANVVVAEASHARGVNISFYNYFKVGSLLTLVALLISSGYLYLRFLM
ncbi:MAG: ArsB/NhaD family transporter [Candidatus Margulisiibacteriota bacterium]|jgi:Na+/H+ antiporter NhaD/arsenite permease-like protein